ncbi:hypothetical protein CIB48_g10553, partial [Xylaria polymorpha]
MHATRNRLREHVEGISLGIARDVLDVDAVGEGIVDALDDVAVLHDLAHEASLVSPVGGGAGAQVLVAQARVLDDADGAQPALGGQQLAGDGLDADGR